MPFTRKVKWEEEIENIKELGLKGLTMAQVARHYDVSTQRLQQITRRFIPDWVENYGTAVKRKKRSQDYFDKWGVREDTDLYSVKREKFRAKKSNAKRLGKHWNLDFGDLEWPTHCPILGIELDYFAEGRQENSVSFDQRNPNEGYVKGNVQILSWRANRIKNDGSADEHRLIAEYLTNLDTQA